MKRHLSIILLSALAAGAAWAATPLPSWYPGPNTTRQGYNFTNANLTPTPDILDNNYGTPSANVNLGVFSSGWQDPASSFAISGVAPPDGAWDLGTAGSFTVVCNFAGTPLLPGETFSVDFLVYSVAYYGITALPNLDLAPLGLSNSDVTYTQSLVAPDPNFPFANWQGQTWTGTSKNVTSNQLSFRIAAPDNLSVIDTVEVFTRFTIVPEPSTWLMLGSAAAGLLCRRRRI